MKLTTNRLTPRLILTAIYLMGFLGIVASGGGGGGGSSDDGDAPVTAAMPALDFDIKTFRFTWTDVGDATHYRLLENPDGLSGFSNVSADIPQGTQTFDHIVALYERANASYILQSCNDYGCTDSGAVFITGTLVDAIGYLTASNSSGGDRFGNSISLSGDGNTLAVGAHFEDSNATGIDGDQSDNSAALSGAVYVFTRSGSLWTQQAYIKASNTDADDDFGISVSLSNDGNTLAVGAYGEASNATGINGNQADNSLLNPGAVYIFTRSGTTWTQQAYIKASNTDARDLFGDSVSLSNDGNTLAVGANGEASNATGINGNQADNSLSSSGAVYIFTRSGTTWTQQAYIKASNTGSDDRFGTTVSLSGDGNTLAASAIREDSGATDSGAVYIFTRSGVSWIQRAFIKASYTHNDYQFGGDVSLDGFGNTLAVGSCNEASNATGINGNQTDTSADDAGAVHVFTRSGATWSQQAYIKATNTDHHDWFCKVSLSDDGNTLAVGADGEASIATGINGNQADNSGIDAGAVYLFRRSGGSTWSQQAYIKASNTGLGRDFFGYRVSLNADGNTLAVGAALKEAAYIY